MRGPVYRPDRLSLGALTDATERFCEWSRSEEAVTVLDGVCHGSIEAENKLLGAFIKAIHPEDQLTRADFSSASRREGPSS